MSDSIQAGIVIIGAGQAGVQTAESLRAGGYAGRITLLGDEPYGPYHRPPLSKAWLAGEMDGAQLVMRAPEMLARKNIELRTEVKVASIDRAAKQAGLTTGLDAQVGERGIMLSGGEKQRLAIARTLLSAPSILLLDESTASLDGVNERLMREALDSVATGRTLIVIAHRLSTVVDSDRIIVLDSGRVVGEGTHDELIESTPLYRELAKHQLLVPEQG